MSHELMLHIERPKGVSSQPLAEDATTSRIVRSDIIEPPEDLGMFMDLTGTNSQRRGILEALVVSTVGLGYTVEVDTDHQRDVAPHEAKRAYHTLEALAGRDRKSHNPSMTELLYRARWDEEECGSGYVEVSRNRLGGNIDGLFYVPGVRMRRLRERDGWVLLPEDEIGLDGRRRGVFFYNFGEKVKYNEDGTPRATLEAGRRWARNEIIPFQLFTSESVDYGLPRDAGMALEYAGDKLAAQSNVSFFDASGTPPMLIFVKGEAKKGPGGEVQMTVPQGLVEDIGAMIKSDGRYPNRVGIVPLPDGSSVDSVDLGRISDRDVGFTEFRKDILRRQLGNVRVSPIFVASTEDGGRYAAEVERAITLEQVFDPEQRRWEERLHRTLYRDLGIPHLIHRFKRLAIENDATRRESADRLAEKGAITNGEYREAHGWAALPEAKENEEPKPGEVPFGWNGELVEAAGGPPPSELPVLDNEDTRGLRPRLAGRPVKRNDPALPGGGKNGNRPK